MDLSLITFCKFIKTFVFVFFSYKLYQVISCTLLLSLFWLIIHSNKSGLSLYKLMDNESDFDFDISPSDICDHSRFLFFLIRPFGISVPKTFLFVLISNILTWSIPDDVYSRKAVCAVNIHVLILHSEHFILYLHHSCHSFSFFLINVKNFAQIYILASYCQFKPTLDKEQK